MPNLFPEDINLKENDIEEQIKEPEYKGSYLFDFEKGEFVINPDGFIAKCDDFQAYKQWCQKAMLTPRYKFAYSDLYGQDLKDLIGDILSKSAIELEIQRITKETLMVHPRTKDVVDFSFNWSDGNVYYTYEVIPIDREKFMLHKTIKVR